MNKPMKVVDGTDTRRAPVPKHGLQRAVFRTVEALERATENAVYEMLPAAITKGNQIITHKKLLRSLKNGVYRGYFMTDKGVYSIAPLAYYNARQIYIDGLPGLSRGTEGNKNGHHEPYLFDHSDGITIHINQRTLFFLKFILYIAAFAGAVYIGRILP